MTAWFDEEYEGTLRFGLKGGRVLFDQRSEYQRVTIIDSEAFGPALLLDGMWMTAVREEKQYHELLVHPAMTTAPRVERVLVVGGGDGGTAREVLRYPEVARVDMVELDGMVVDACREHMPSLAPPWDEPRLHLRIGDGVAFLRDVAEASYDVILVDGTDPIGPAEDLFGESFLRSCSRALRPGGVLAAQSGSPLVQEDVHVGFIRTARRVFGQAWPYYGTVSLYPAGAWSWTWAAATGSPLELAEARAERIEQVTTLWNRDVHRGAFAVPNFIRRALAEPTVAAR